MTRARTSDLTTHHINLFKGDLNRLRELFPGHDPSKIVRALVRDCITKLETKDPTYDRVKIKVNL